MSEKKRFLVVKTSSLGDIIQSFPVVSYLKEKFSSALIDWVVEKPFSEMIRSHPDINESLCIDTKMWRASPFSKETISEFREFKRRLQKTTYDTVFDLQSNLKSSLITWLSIGHQKVGFGKKSVHEWPNLFVTNFKVDPPKGVNIREDYLKVVQGYFGDENEFQHAGVSLKISKEQEKLIHEILANPILNCSPRIMVCPGANWKNKQLSHDTLIDFLLRIHHSIGAKILLAWGSESERELALSVQRKLSTCSLVLPKLALAPLQNLMSKLDLIIAMDSLPLHLAATTPTATYSVFGPSLATKFKPIGEKHHAFQGTCPYEQKFEKRCPILRTCQTGACMRTLRAHSLTEDFLIWWKGFENRGVEKR